MDEDGMRRTDLGPCPTPRGGHPALPGHGPGQLPGQVA